MIRTLLAHNADAGTEETSSAELIALFRQHGHDPHVCSTEPDVLETALAGDWDLIVAAGGDGTVARVLLALPDRSVPVTVLPLGGSNNIAHALGIAGQPEAIAAALAGWRPAFVDIGIADGAWGRSCFVEAVGFGLLTDALHDIGGSPDTAEEKRRVGLQAIVQALETAKPADYRLRLEERELSVSALMLEVLNIPRIGPRLPLAPSAQIGDGMLDVVLLHAEQRDAFIAWLSAPEGTPPPLTACRVRELTILEAPDHCRLDDPKRGRSTEGKQVRLRIDPMKCRVLVPDNQQESQS